MSEYKYRPRKVVSPATRDKIKRMMGRDFSRARKAIEEGPAAPPSSVVRKGNGWAGTVRWGGRRYSTQIFECEELARAAIPALRRQLENMSYHGSLPPPKK